MSLEPSCPDLATWRIAAIAPGQDWLVLDLDSMRRAVACPLCGTQSQHVHSHYHRTSRDLPFGWWPVRLFVQTRRLLCDAPTFRRRIHVEPFLRVLAR